MGSVEENWGEHNEIHFDRPRLSAAVGRSQSRVESCRFSRLYINTVGTQLAIKCMESSMNSDEKLIIVAD